MPALFLKGDYQNNLNMLQFITAANERYSVKDEVEMLLKGGCRWIQLSEINYGDDETTVKEVARQLMPMCEPEDAFLVIDDDVDLVDELKVHGVFLRDNSRSNVMAVREKLGAHAVVGVLATTFEEVMELRGLDIDYISVPVPQGDESVKVADRYAGLINRIRENGIAYHIVAMGDFALDELPELIEAGCAGVAMSKSILDTPDPVVATSQILDTLENALMKADDELKEE